jgi:transcriptional regulator with XRE-family HTH domain
MQSKATPREKRRAAGLSQVTVAVSAGVSLPTLRLYEANPNAVTDDKRAALDKAYAAMKPKEAR